jgi:hypothetical protein
VFPILINASRRADSESVEILLSNIITTIKNIFGIEFAKDFRFVLMLPLHRPWEQWIHDSHDVGQYPLEIKNNRTYLKNNQRAIDKIKRL